VAHFLFLGFFCILVVVVEVTEMDGGGLNGFGG
jgi:hypothetical protein